MKFFLRAAVLSAILAYVTEGFSSLVPPLSWPKLRPCSTRLEAAKSPSELPAYVVSVYQLHKNFIPPWFRQVYDVPQGPSVTRTQTQSSLRLASVVDFGKFHRPHSNQDDDALLRPMATQAADFAKKRGVDYDMFTRSMSKDTPEKQSPGVPLDYGLFPIASDTQIQEDEELLHPMALRAAEFAKKKSVDWGMYVKYAPSDNGSRHDKVPIDYGLFVLPPPSNGDMDDLLRPMAANAADFFHKKGIDFGIFSTNNHADMDSSTTYPQIADYPTPTHNRPKDDFTPTPGQTAMHPFIKWFAPEMATEFAAIVDKMIQKSHDNLPTPAAAAALPDPAWQMHQSFPNDKNAHPLHERVLQDRSTNQQAESSNTPSTSASAT